eukprot:scpid94378/ scgid6637/ 
MPTVGVTGAPRFGMPQTPCYDIANCARRLASSYVDPASLGAYVASRLIPLDKRPGVRPIGIGEVLRWIVGKAILSIVVSDIQEAAGSSQLRAGQECGIESAIHAMREVFDNSDREYTPLADATNAFNSINREVCLRNIQHLCPALAQVAMDCYRDPSHPFVGGESLFSSERTKQDDHGDPIAMPLYAIAVLPLNLAVATEGSTQALYANDAAWCWWQGCKRPLLVGRSYE